MGWCALIPTMCHPRKEIPFCSIKSPRRNTLYRDIERNSSLASLENLRRTSGTDEESANINEPPINESLHPKYSLPFFEISVAGQKIK
ncbi:unnamed protein product [Enterobius vermicularis]|uniref:Uncharacterized protein n=1 Tax=Enterobius vermicularis TaxID=51028 RepID=A0A0N4UWG0_ENTVE|nr:unnamed protein product [Enterobius vermicularis]